MLGTTLSSKAKTLLRFEKQFGLWQHVERFTSRAVWVKTDLQAVVRFVLFFFCLVFFFIPTIIPSMYFWRNVNCSYILLTSQCKTSTRMCDRAGIGPTCSACGKGLGHTGKNILCFCTDVLVPSHWSTGWTPRKGGGEGESWNVSRSSVQPAVCSSSSPGVLQGATRTLMRL